MAPRTKSPRASTSDGSRQKALNLYQDAFADVGNGDYSDALGKLQRSIELDPTSAAAQKEIAICYSHLRQPDKGAAHYEQYLKLRPDAPDAADVRKMLSDYNASKGSDLVP
jgi:Tfp pilus assembly protein PilF